MLRALALFVALSGASSALACGPYAFWEPTEAISNNRGVQGLDTTLWGVTRRGQLGDVTVLGGHIYSIVAVETFDARGNRLATWELGERVLGEVEEMEIDPISGLIRVSGADMIGGKRWTALLDENLRQISLDIQG